VQRAEGADTILNAAIAVASDGINAVAEQGARERLPLPEVPTEHIFGEMSSRLDVISAMCGPLPGDGDDGAGIGMDMDMGMGGTGQAGEDTPGLGIGIGIPGKRRRVDGEAPPSTPALPVASPVGGSAALDGGAIGHQI